MNKQLVGIEFVALNYKVFRKWLLCFSLSHKQLTCFLWALVTKRKAAHKKQEVI